MAARSPCRGRGSGNGGRICARPGHQPADVARRQYTALISARSPCLSRNTPTRGPSKDALIHGVSAWNSNAAMAAK
jgi:hypothetical protein